MRHLVNQSSPAGSGAYRERVTHQPEVGWRRQVDGKRHWSVDPGRHQLGGTGLSLMWTASRH